MEVKFTGFSDILNGGIEKKNPQTEDVYSQIFSALLGNMLPNIQSVQLVNQDIALENKEDINFCTDLLNSNGNGLEGLDTKYTCMNPELHKIISEFKNIMKDDKGDEFLKTLPEFKSILDGINNGKVGETSEMFKDLQKIIDVLENDNNPGKIANHPLKKAVKFLTENNFTVKDSLTNDIDPKELVSFKDVKESNNGEKVKNIEDALLETKFKTIEDQKMVKGQHFVTEDMKANFQVSKDNGINNESIELTKLITKPEDLIEVTVDKFKGLKLPDRTELSVKLRPEELGEITVKIVLEKGQINGNILAENKDVVSILKNQMDNLKQELKNNNVNLSSISVNLANDNQLNSGDNKREFYHQNNQKNNGEYLSFENDAYLSEEEGFTIMA